MFWSTGTIKSVFKMLFSFKSRLPRDVSFYLFLSGDFFIVFRRSFVERRNGLVF